LVNEPLLVNVPNPAVLLSKVFTNTITDSAPIENSVDAGTEIPLIGSVPVKAYATAWAEAVLKLLLTAVPGAAIPGPYPMQDLSSGGKKGVAFESVHSPRLFPMNSASSARTSVNAALKWTGFDVVEPEQFVFVELPPCNAFHTATGRPTVAV